MLLSELPKLEWEYLINKIAGSCMTEEASERVKAITPTLSQAEILTSWAFLTPLKQLIDSGYTPNVGNLDPMGRIFKALELGSILDGEDLRMVFTLLESTKNVNNFCEDFLNKCNVLEKFKSRLFPLPKMLSNIEKAIDPDGSVKDDASKELSSIRGQKRHLATRVQNKIKSILHDQEVEMYLQDDFFTVRNGKYVIPMKLDGHGRIKGNVIDTSGSGQTLFLEPIEVAESNQKLQDLESEEKLEILKILRALSAQLSGHLDELESSYQAQVDLDFYTSQSKIFSQLECNQPNLSKEHCISLVDAFHPILKLNEGDAVVENSIHLEKDQSCLVISGPNAGGKTVVLKTVALCHIMAKCGFLIPCSKDSEVYLFDNIYLEMGDGQSVTQSLSTFSSHLHGLKPIVDKATKNDLVLLDEIAVGTEPNIGAAIAQAVLEKLSELKVTTLVTTHFEKLKILAIENKNMRNASMEYSSKTFSPTFKLILDVPGQSFALELAQKIGFSKEILDRAKLLSGQNTTDLEKVISEVLKIKQTAMSESKELKELQLEAEKQKNRWSHEVELLQQTRKKAAEKLQVRFEKQLKDKMAEVDEAKKELRNVKATETKHLQTAKSHANKSLGGLKEGIDELKQFTKEDKPLPGFDLSWDQAEEGMEVHVIPLEKKGKITKISKEKSLIEVQVGLLKVRSKISELRRLKVLKGGSKPVQKPSNSFQQKVESSEGDFIVQTSSNTVNLRGLDTYEGVNKAMSFIDSGLLKGEKTLFLIHGHGTSALKNFLRDKLKNDCPYDIRFRPGTPEEGGDGVTVVSFL